jgi:hypothetical protein
MSIGTLDPVQISEWSPRDPLHYHIPCGQMFKWSRDPARDSYQTLALVQTSEWSPRDPLHYHIPCGQMFKWSRDPRLSSNYSPSSLSPSG